MKKTVLLFLVVLVFCGCCREHSFRKDPVRYLNANRKVAPNLLYIKRYTLAQTPLYRSILSQTKGYYRHQSMLTRDVDEDPVRYFNAQLFLDGGIKSSLRDYFFLQDRIRRENWRMTWIYARNQKKLPRALWKSFTSYLRSQEKNRSLLYPRAKNYLLANARISAELPHFVLSYWRLQSKVKQKMIKDVQTYLSSQPGLMVEMQGGAQRYFRSMSGSILMSLEKISSYSNYQRRLVGLLREDSAKYYRETTVYMRKVWKAPVRYIRGQSHLATDLSPSIRRFLKSQPAMAQKSFKDIQRYLSYNKDVVRDMLFDLNQYKNVQDKNARLLPGVVKQYVGNQIKFLGRVFFDPKNYFRGVSNNWRGLRMEFMEKLKCPDWARNGNF